MATRKAPRRDCSAVLRRQPSEITCGRPRGGYTGAFEIICPGCGDHPDVEYRDAPVRLQKLRGPYPLTEGIAAYEVHYAWHQARHPAPARGSRVAYPGGPATGADAG